MTRLGRRHRAPALADTALLPYQSDAPAPGMPDASNTITDITPYKRYVPATHLARTPPLNSGHRWTCIYPIYINAKRPCGRGEQRIPRAKNVWWPLSKDIADTTNRLGLGTLHEVNKAHPRDWENPGRVRVQWKKDGRFVNPAIKTSTSCRSRGEPGALPPPRMSCSCPCRHRAPAPLKPQWTPHSHPCLCHTPVPADTARAISPPTPRDWATALPPPPMPCNVPLPYPRSEPAKQSYRIHSSSSSSV